MKILVLVKEVPDTYGERRLDLETGLVDRAGGEAVLDEVSERALELALGYSDAGGDAEIVTVTVAPESAITSVRKGLAMGADRAIHIVDEQLAGADAPFTAEVLAAAIKQEGFDLVIAGNSSTDGGSSIVPTAIAEHLGAAVLTWLSEVEISEDRVSGTRALDIGTQKVVAELPAVISVTEALPEARFPNFKGIMAAKKKPVDTLSLSDLGLSDDYTASARAIVLRVSEKPPRDAGIKIEDDGSAAEKLADYLVENQLV